MRKFFIFEITKKTPGSGLAFAFPLNSTLVRKFSNEILSLHTHGEMAELHTKWFKTTSECSKHKLLTGSNHVLDFQHIRGILYTYLAGVILSLLLFVFDFRTRKIKESSNNKTNESLETAEMGFPCSTMGNQSRNYGEDKIEDSTEKPRENRTGEIQESSDSKP